MSVDGARSDDHLVGNVHLSVLSLRRACVSHGGTMQWNDFAYRRTILYTGNDFICRLQLL